MKIEQVSRKSIHTDEEVKKKMLDLYDELFRHDGYGEMKVVIRLLRRGQKEIIFHCGKEYRFIVEYLKLKKAE